MKINLFNVSPEIVGTFDLVILMGVIYHLRHPLLGLEKLYDVTKGFAIVETSTDMLDCERPSIAFYPENERSDNPSNWWGPNAACVEGMLKTAGFSKVELVSQSPIGYRVSGVAGTNDPKSPLSSRIPSNRVVFHAWK